MYQLQFRDVLSAWNLFLDGLLLTLGLSGIALGGGLLLGIAVAVTRVYGPGWAARTVTVYIEIIRNTPLLVQLFTVYFGLPSLGIRIPGLYAAMICFVIYLGAYLAEIIRAGMEAVPQSQKEAGACLGLSGYQVFRYVVLVPAIKDMFPALASQFIFFMLSTSVVSQIAVSDLFHMGSIVQAMTYRDFEIYLLIGALYLALALLFRAGFATIYLLCFGGDE
ncbi:amino acid ABC transporter permease protein (plasmid) [Rhizobium etli bv. phaseoli str. IE4803]|nr:amino acid ABC transporter permease protein [Rhizobium etli bv. phaseoli str. IE4803]